MGVSQHSESLALAKRLKDPNDSTEPSQSVTVLQGFWNGEGGIRTHGAREDTLVFKTRAINHSTTSPKVYPTRIHKRILATCAASKAALLDESPLVL